MKRLNTNQTATAASVSDLLGHQRLCAEEAHLINKYKHQTTSPLMLRITIGVTLRYYTSHTTSHITTSYRTATPLTSTNTNTNTYTNTATHLVPRNNPLNSEE